MACVTDPDIEKHFSNKLEEIRNELLTVAVGDMTDAETELRRAHHDFLRSVKDTCLKKCKEDGNMFETIQMYRNDVQQNRALCKEAGDAIPEVLSEKEEKEMQKESLMQQIRRLREDQAKKKEMIICQNKVNKDKLKSLNKAKQVFQDWLGLEIRKIHGDKLQFIFRSINDKDPESAYIFTLRINEEGSYEVVSCDPPLERMAHLESRLRETNNFSAFLANVRKEFASLLKT